ncbi:MAG: hypothetical protein QNJ15_11065 [Erythrobacter sp.]|nr:hypothetical protein [Erythrobacter sp.]
MYIVGHCLSVIDSGMCSSEQMDEFGVVATMLPDILDNHAWGYSTCFDWPGRSSITPFIHAHMVGDWFVHFGLDKQVMEREGWAYQRMGYFADQYEDFFDGATSAQVAYQRTPTDTRRGFSHTMAEYSVDLWLAKTGRFDAYFETARKSLGALAREDDDGVGSIHWLRRVAANEGMPTDLRSVAGQVESFRARAAMAKSPEEFVVYSIISKLDFKLEKESVDYVMSSLEDGITHLTEAELDKHYKECCDFIAINPSPVAAVAA